MPANLYFQLSQCLEISIFNFLDISNYTPCYIQVKTKGVAKSAPISVFLPSIYNRYTGHPLVSCVHWTKMKEWCFPSQSPTLAQLTHNRHLYLEKKLPIKWRKLPIKWIHALSWGHWSYSHSYVKNQLSNIHRTRLEICQKIYMTGLFGQKIYTPKVRKLRLFLLNKKQRKCINISYFSRFFVRI